MVYRVKFEHYFNKANFPGFLRVCLVFVTELYTAEYIFVTQHCQPNEIYELEGKFIFTKEHFLLSKIKDGTIKSVYVVYEPTCANTCCHVYLKDFVVKLTLNNGP